MIQNVLFRALRDEHAHAGRMRLRNRLDEPCPFSMFSLWLLQEIGPSQMLVLQAYTQRASLISSAATVAFI